MIFWDIIFNKRRIKATPQESFNMVWQHKDKLEKANVRIFIWLIILLYLALYLLLNLIIIIIIGIN